MQSWDNYQRVKGRADEALRVLGYVGKEQSTTARDVGKLHGLTVKTIIHYQPTDGAKNYHESGPLDDALAQAAREMWPQLAARAREILTASCAEALAATRSDLQAALAEIDALESPAS